MRTFLIIFLAGFCVASGPKYSFKDSRLNDELDNVYFDIGNIPTMTYLTKAQLLTLTPKRTGLLYFCTDCTTDGVVVSTAATPAGISRISSKTTAIN